jgi:hypothetical protein
VHEADAALNFCGMLKTPHVLQAACQLFLHTPSVDLLSLLLLLPVVLRCICHIVACNAALARSRQLRSTQMQTAST